MCLKTNDDLEEKNWTVDVEGKAPEFWDLLEVEKIDAENCFSWKCLAHVLGYIKYRSSYMSFWNFRLRTVIVTLVFRKDAKS